MMARGFLIFVLIIGCGVPIKTLQQTVEVSLRRDYYTAGVVEFRPSLFGMSSADILADHLKAYEEIIRSSTANETDIVVFPEGTLNNMFQMTFVPAVEEKIIPCLAPVNKYADFFKQLSCTARDVKKYLVINLTEKENCTAVEADPRPCASNGLNVYNTNVVFDRSGRVISRYRKVHIYVEAKNTTLEPEYAIFETDFGVRFGHFICFDVQFFTPALELVTKFGVKDVIFTSFFYSELPFLTATQLQQSWAWGNNVNVLAAGASYPASGTTGSGIFAGNKGHLVSVMKGGIGERKLYVSRVPKFSAKIQLEATKSNSKNPKIRITDIKLMKDPQLRSYNSTLLRFSVEPYSALELCHQNFCCHLKVNVTYLEPPKDAVTYQYRFGVYNGNRTYEKIEWSDIRVCALYTCTNEELSSCGEMFDANATVVMNVNFESIEVNGRFDKIDGESLIMPNTLDDQLYSLNADAVDWEKKDKGNHFDVNMKLTKPQQNLLTFGIYSNYFERSNDAVVPSNIYALLFCSLMAFLFLGL